MSHIGLVLRKLFTRILLAAGSVALIVLTGYGLYYATSWFESSSYDVVAIFLILIIGSNVLAKFAGSYIDA